MADEEATVEGSAGSDADVQDAGEGASAEGAGSAGQQDQGEEKYLGAYVPVTQEQERVVAVPPEEEPAEAD